jgi:UDP-3-O-[3-hydroxymyristoyl] glucosamine N-acyltransferase
MSMTVGELAGKIGAEWRGDASLVIERCATLEAAGPEELSFVANPRYLSRLGDSRAGAVVLAPGDAAGVADRTVLVAADPYFAFREALVLLHGWRQQPEVGISPLASIDDSAVIAELCTIRPFVYVAPHAVIGKRCILYPGVYVGKGARLGDDCILHPNVCVYDGCVLGNRVTLHAGCVIGQDGFGYATHARDGEPVEHHKIPATGNAVIEDDVEMGANCSVDRATLGSTVVGRGTKFSNSVTIGHGSRVGPYNLYVAQVGLAGSVETGAYVVMGGQVGVAGHLKIGDQAQIAATSGVMHDVPAKTQVGGTPAMPFTDAKRVLIHQQRLPEMAQTIRQLQRRIEQLEAERGSAGQPGRGSRD